MPGPPLSDSVERPELDDMYQPCSLRTWVGGALLLVRLLCYHVVSPLGGGKPCLEMLFLPNKIVASNFD